MNAPQTGKRGMAAARRLPPLSPLLRRRSLFMASQLLALGVALLVARHGYDLFYAERGALDEWLLWSSLAVVLLTYFAWDGRLPRFSLRGSALSLRAAVIENRVEIAAVTVVFLVGVAVRLYTYATTPNGYLCCEEHINGGVAWEVLQGDRPIAYASVRYLTALGLWLFGPSTLGLRAGMVFTGIAAVLAFYVLCRQVAGLWAALFATALFASLRVLGDPTWHFQEPMLGAILLALVALRGLRTLFAPWFVLAGLLAALLSYEYETFKAVPLFLAAFVVFRLGLSFVGFRPWMSRERALQGLRLAGRAIRPVVILVVTILIGIGPMLAERHRGQDVYFGSLHRQEADREARGAPGLFAPNARTQLTWAVQVFTPALERGYPSVGSIAAGDVPDRATSIFIWIGVAGALVAFWRGARSLFLVWFLGGVAGASLLLSNFAAWKIVGFIPPALVLAGCAVDDILRLTRRYAPRVVPILVVGLAGVAAYALSSNVRVQADISEDPAVLREFANTASQLYAICDYLSDRPRDNYSFVAQRARSGWGFSGEWVDDRERRRAWSDWTFVCWDLKGKAVSSLDELWPVRYSMGPADRPVTILALGRPEEVRRSFDDLRRALPQLGEPAVVRRSPGGIFELWTFETDVATLTAREGLLLHAYSSSGALLDEQLVHPVHFNLSALPAEATRMELLGLVHLGEDAGLCPELTVEGVYGADLQVDGNSVSPGDDHGGEGDAACPSRGWHRVRVSAWLSVRGQFSLVWRGGVGTVRYPQPEDFFPIDHSRGWTNQRVFDVDGERVEVVRFAFEPHVTAKDGLQLDTGAPLPDGATVREDVWRGLWTVGRQGTYVLRVPASSEARLFVDGSEVLSGVVGERSVEVNLSAGEHTIDLVFAGGDGTAFGGSLSLLDDEGRLLPMDVAPR